MLTPWQRFRREPSRCLAKWLYQRRPHPSHTGHDPQPDRPPAVSIVCISDTHNACPAVPDGDMLLHAGDLTSKGSFAELQSQLDWLNSLPHRHKVVIGGNHDLLLDPAFVSRFPDRIYEGEGTARSDLDWGGIVYLNNSTARLEFGPDNGHCSRSLTVYGSPWTEQMGVFAFQYPPVRAVWPDAIPPGTDVVLTHGPPRGYLDEGGKGCPRLLRELRRARPRLAVFGHVHGGHGGHGVDCMAFDGLGAAYGAVMVGDRGLLAALAVMPLLLAWSWLCETVLSPLLFPRRPAAGATLVNAAVAPARLSDTLQTPVVVEL